MSVVMYHNPRCSKSRRTLELLQENGVNPQLVLYLETPPTAAELEAVLQQLHMHPKDILRFGEDRAEELGLSEHDRRSDAEWIDLLVANPVLIERPIVIRDGRAAVCRPPEKVLELLE